MRLVVVLPVEQVGAAMPTFVCVRCGKAVPEDAVVRDANGQVYHATCLQEVSATAGSRVVITEVRIPFSTVFTLTSQVLATVAVWSLVLWVVSSCWRFAGGR